MDSDAARKVLWGLVLDTRLNSIEGSFTRLPRGGPPAHSKGCLTDSYRACEIARRTSFAPSLSGASYSGAFIISVEILRSPCLEGSEH
jgi:hypothetical protein